MQSRQLTKDTEHPCMFTRRVPIFDHIIETLMVSSSSYSTVHISG